MENLEFYPDFDDVLIKANMSDINSRKEVDLRVQGKKWNPIPIMSANMDTVTDVESAFELLKFNWVPVLHKYVSIPDITKLFDKIEEYNEAALKNNKNVDKNDSFKDILSYNNAVFQYNQFLEEDKKIYLIDSKNLFISRGTSDRDKEKLKDRLEQEPRIQSYCIDVANGHRKSIIPYLQSLKEEYPDKTLMAGNIITSEAAILYAKAGVDIAKCGIGPGCFKKGSQVLTKDGLKNIENIEPGKDFVLTHTNSYQKVLNKMFYTEKDKLISVNGIESTINHEYYVVLKDDASKITEDNLHEFAMWVKAKDLDKEKHLLVDLND